MQVVNSTAFAAGTFGAKRPADKDRSAGAAAVYVSNSTRLSAAEKSSFIRALTAVGDDTKQIARIMAAVQVTETTREDHSYDAGGVKIKAEEKHAPLPLDKPVLAGEKPLFGAPKSIDILA